MIGEAPNVSHAETAKFDRLAARWWDLNGESRPLHDLNPVRTNYVADRVKLDGATVLDVGCGGGILSESLARAGAHVTGIDLAERVLDVAKLHLHESKLDVDYRQISVEDLAAEAAGTFDAITCMEMLEHVPDPGSVISAIVGAEYALNLLPRGTHHYAHFIKPSELATSLRSAGLELDDVSGLAYNPLSRHAWIAKSTQVNYLASAHKPG